MAAPVSARRIEAGYAADPHAPIDELRVTWIGHVTFLVQIGGFNLLTDPHWSRRASPVQFAGPRRLTPPGVPWIRLPAIDAVLLSHNHYDMPAPLAPAGRRPA